MVVHVPQVVPPPTLVTPRFTLDAIHSVHFCSTTVLQSTVVPIVHDAELSTISAYAIFVPPSTASIAATTATANAIPSRFIIFYLVRIVIDRPVPPPPPSLSTQRQRRANRTVIHTTPPRKSSVVSTPAIIHTPPRRCVSRMRTTCSSDSAALELPVVSKRTRDS